MKSIENFKKELPFGNILVCGGFVYLGMLLLLNIFLLITKMGFPIDEILLYRAEISTLLLTLLISLFIFIFIIFTVLIPKVMLIYPIVGYYFIFIKDNRLVKILPISNKEKYINLLKNWSKIVGGYLFLLIIEILYLAILFGNGFMLILEELPMLYLILINGIGVSFLSTLLFTFSIIIASMIQNIYKISIWKVVVTYIAGYFTLYIVRALAMNQDSIFQNLIYSGLYDFNWYMILIGSAYLVIFVCELIWTVKNINRIRVM